MNNDNTMKARAKQSTGEMKAEYDFLAGVRGKYAERYQLGTNVVLLEPEIAEAFPDSKSVNDALRVLLAVATRSKSKR